LVLTSIKLKARKPLIGINRTILELSRFRDSMLSALYPLTSIKFKFILSTFNQQKAESQEALDRD
jgi:hypothetical protein